MYKVKLIQNNRSGSRLNPKGVVVHETATPGATAEREYQYFNGGDRGASAKCLRRTSGITLAHATV